MLAGESRYASESRKFDTAFGRTKMRLHDDENTRLLGLTPPARRRFSPTKLEEEEAAMLPLKDWSKLVGAFEARLTTEEGEEGITCWPEGNLEATTAVTAIGPREPAPGRPPKES